MMFILRKILLTLMIFSFMVCDSFSVSPWQTYEKGVIDIYNGETRQQNDIVLALDLPYKLCSKCYDKHAGSGYNTGNFYASAAALAIADINSNENLLSNYTLRYVSHINKTDTHCNEMDAIRITMEQLNLDVDGFLGFTCHCKTVAKMISAVNLPFFSGSCAEMDLSKKNEYPTFARTTTLNSDVIYMILKFLKKYNWNKFAIMYEKSHIWRSVYDALKIEVDNSNTLEIALTENFLKTDSFMYMHDSLSHIFIPFLDALPKKARIVLLMIDKGNLQQFMLLASKKNLTNGEYVFIAVHPFATFETALRDVQYLKNHIWVLPWTRNHENSDATATLSAPVHILEKAYQSLFVLVPQIPDHHDMHDRYTQFLHRVRQGMSMEPFCSDVYTGVFKDQSFRNLTKPPPEALQLYDAVMLYALGLNKTISKGYDIRNGTDIIQNIMNTEHRSISGSPYAVNCKADVQVLFEVVQFQFDGKDEEGRTSIKTKYWLPKRIFVFETREGRNERNCSDKQSDRERFILKKIKNSFNVKWLLGEVPTDVPKCGFNNENCPSPGTPKGAMVGLGISLGLMAIFIFVIPFFLYRNYHLKKELNAQPWKIQAAELFYHDWSVSTSSLGSLTSHAESIHYEMPTKQQFITTAYYKGTLVAVKKVNKRNVELSKSVLMELKQIRDVRNENLNQFIGACVEPNNILIITTYASRGSLQDILEDNDIQLDAPFILSLVYDIIKAMMYLHSTDIKSHGNLKSSNCVIDSRWVLKITDFGLNTFRSKQGTISSIESEHCNSLLWKSPELLRLNIPPTSRGTQKGDVYSFGIILQECHTRDGAWGSYQDPEAIVERVKMRLNPPFRPVVKELLDGAEGLRDTMKKCWHENPEERPYFSELRKDVEVMMKANGMRANLVENMIIMLEKYSKNLEEVVAERTTSLREEKHKVESLLERMLPRSVASQLMQGMQVEAESFEEVTIYFSDVVGFTTVCSLITPMEVVNLLNTLYTMFDNIANDYDVYKVETIGDAYMVVSGLPIRNMKQHAKEITVMALDIMENMKSFKIRPNDKPIQIRIGIHTGPVVAGVVGTTMPRYCLFGDTVNVAARMESTGEPCRIHLSHKTRNALSQFGEFIISPRGITTVKGRGEMNTYWLDGIESKLMRKRTITKRDQNALYQQNKHSPSFSRLIRESPKVPRHKLHITPTTNDYPRTPPLNPPPPPSSKEQRSLNYLKKPFSSCKKTRNSFKGGHLEMANFTNSNETQSLIANGVSFSSPGNELSVPHRTMTS